MIKFLKNKFFILMAFLYLLHATVLFADIGDDGGTTQLQNPTTIGSIQELLTAILSFVVALGAPIVTLAIIYAGFKFVAARGNSTKLEEAKTYLVYVLVGAAIILGAFVLKDVISGTVSKIQADL